MVVAKRKYRWVKRILLAALASVLAGLMLYGFLAFYPAGDDDLKKKSAGLMRQTNDLLRPAEDQDSQDARRELADGAFPPLIGTLPGSLLTLDGKNDCTPLLQELNKTTAAEWIQEHGFLGEIEFMLPASLFNPEAISAPLAVSPEVMRRIIANAAPRMAACRLNYGDFYKGWPRNDATTASLHLLLDRTQALLLDPHAGYPEFGKFPDNENLFGFHTLAVLAIERASLRGERGKVARLLQRYLEHERSYHIGQFPPYWEDSIPLARAASALWILGEAGALTDEDMARAQASVRRFLLSPAQIALLRQAHALRLSEAWARDLDEMRARPETTFWRRLTRQVPAATVAFFSRPLIRNQVRRYAVAVASGDPRAIRRAHTMFYLSSRPSAMMNNGDMLKPSVQWNDLYSGKLTCTDTAINAGAWQAQLVLAAVRCHKSAGRYPARFGDLAPWLDPPIPADARSAWEIGLMPEQDALAWIGAHSRAHPGPDPIDRAITRYHDEHRKWPLSAGALRPYLNPGDETTTLSQRLVHLHAAPLFCYFERDTLSTRSIDSGEWERLYDGEFACLTPEERAAMRQRFARGERLDLVRVSIRFPVYPLLSERLKNMLRP